MASGFVYIWMDTKRYMFYIGSHIGQIDDGYICSSKRMLSVFKKRPDTFKRRIIEQYDNIDNAYIKQRENYWLSKIDITLLGSKYYNLKNVACGGNIVHSLSAEKREQHRIKSINARVEARRRWYSTLTSEEKTSRAKYARSKVNNAFKISEAGAVTLHNRKHTDAFMTPNGPRSFITHAAKEFKTSYKSLRNKIDKNIDGFYWMNKSAHFYKEVSNER